MSEAMICYRFERRYEYFFGEIRVILIILEIYGSRFFIFVDGFRLLRIEI